MHLAAVLHDCKINDIVTKTVSLRGAMQLFIYTSFAKASVMMMMMMMIVNTANWSRVRGGDLVT